MSRGGKMSLGDFMGVQTGKRLPTGPRQSSEDDTGDRRGYGRGNSSYRDQDGEGGSWGRNDGGGRGGYDGGGRGYGSGRGGYSRGGDRDSDRGGGYGDRGGGGRGSGGGFSERSDRGYTDRPGGGFSERSGGGYQERGGGGYQDRSGGGYGERAGGDYGGRSGGGYGRQEQEGGRQGYSNRGFDSRRGDYVDGGGRSEEAAWSRGSGARPATGGYGERDYGSGGGGMGSYRSRPPPTGPDTDAVPAERPASMKLNLTRRTESTKAESSTQPAIPPPTAEPVKKPKPNPFGAAKPVDTATKERMVEKKLMESHVAMAIPFTARQAPTSDYGGSENDWRVSEQSLKDETPAPAVSSPEAPAQPEEPPQELTEQAEESVEEQEEEVEEQGEPQILFGSVGPDLDFSDDEQETPEQQPPAASQISEQETPEQQPPAAPQIREEPPAPAPVQEAPRALTFAEKLKEGGLGGNFEARSPTRQPQTIRAPPTKQQEEPPTPPTQTERPKTRTLADRLKEGGGFEGSSSSDFGRRDNRDSKSSFGGRGERLDPPDTGIGPPQPVNSRWVEDAPTAGDRKSFLGRGEDRMEAGPPQPLNSRWKEDQSPPAERERTKEAWSGNVGRGDGRSERQEPPDVRPPPVSNSRWKEEPATERARTMLEKSSIADRTTPEKPPEVKVKDSEVLEMQETTLINSLATSVSKGEALLKRIKGLPTKPSPRKLLLAILRSQRETGECEWAQEENFGLALKEIFKSKASQIEGIHAFVEYCHERKFPVGISGEPLVLELFKNLYNEDIIEEEAVLSWKGDTEDKSPGRERALQQAVEWLIWLESAEEDEDEEEDADG